MRALSIRQPWIYAILNLNKRVENRNWKTTNSNLRFRGTILLHVSKSKTPVDRLDYEELLWEGGHTPGFISRKKLLAIPSFESMDRGGIVGIADVVGLVTSTTDKWFSGPRGLQLARVKPLPFTPCIGQLGLFHVDTKKLGLHRLIAESGHKIIPETRVKP